MSRRWEQITLAGKVSRVVRSPSRFRRAAGNPRRLCDSATSGAPRHQTQVDGDVPRTASLRCKLDRLAALR
jgi:hypothetical protein